MKIKSNDLLKPLFIQISILIVVLVSLFFIPNKPRMSDTWVAPYLSGAENLTFGGDFMVSVEDIFSYKKLPAKEQNLYFFKQSGDLTWYNHNPIGYAYIIRFATSLIPFIGDQTSILIFQCIVFLCISLLFLSLKELSNLQKWLFFFLFCLNPIVLKFVLYNYYYFWQIVPSAFFAYLYLSRKPNKIIVIIFLLVLPFIFITRTLSIIIIMFSFLWLLKKFDWKYSVVGLTFFIGISFITYKPTLKNFWHTVYVGLGSYPNDYGIKLSDDEGFKLYKDSTGTKIVAKIEGNFYDEQLINDYTSVTKNTFFAIAKEQPFLILKNLLINTLSGYSIGYINKAPTIVNYLIALSGLAFAFSLLIKKKFVWFLVIGFSVGVITLYFPPIQGYIYGTFILSVLAFIDLTTSLIEKRVG